MTKAIGPLESRKSTPNGSAASSTHCMKGARPHAVGDGARDHGAQRAGAEEHEEQQADDARVGLEHVDVVEGHEGREAEGRPGANRHDQDQQRHGAWHVRALAPGAGRGLAARASRASMGSTARSSMPTSDGRQQHAERAARAETRDEERDQRRPERDADVAAQREPRQRGGLAIARHAVAVLYPSGCHAATPRPMTTTSASTPR